MPNNQRHSTICDGTRLVSSPQFQRASLALQNLIITAYERSTSRPGNSLVLTQFRYAYDESSDGKCCTHFDVLVKDLDLNESIPLTLTFAANRPMEEHSQ